jgi:mercuric ion transport protein
MTGMSELVCVPMAIPAGERLGHFALARQLFSQKALERLDLPDGYAIRFSQNDAEAVARFVANERLCCPFLRFEVRAEPDAGSLWLQMTGPQGTREVLEAELSLTHSCRCESPFRAIRNFPKWSALAGLLCSLGLCAACCLLPFALVSIGIAGTWISGLQALAPYKWLFILMTVASLGYGFHATYWRRRASGAAAAAKVSRSERAMRLWLWIATILSVSGLVFEQVEPLLQK